MDDIQVPPDEDTWTLQAIGTPFPKHPVKAPGQVNMYVALWYKHGQPLMGKAWNDSGVVQCAFAYDNKELKGSDIGGNIQVLTYKGDHMSKGFFYEWIKYSEYLADGNNECRVPLHCGTSAPILWPDRGTLGTLNLDKRTAVIAIDQEFHNFTETDLKDMLILVRNTKDGPAQCRCSECELRRELEKATPPPLLMVNEWTDYRAGDTFPVSKRLIKALNRPLNTKDGPQEQFVALWYHFGNAVMGRAWSADGKIAAAFASKTKVFSGNVGSLQLLVQIPPAAAGFDYSWEPYRRAALIGEKEWHPVHIAFAAPCVLIVDSEGHECLGEANLKEEYAQTVLDNKVFRLEGGAIAEFKVSMIAQHEI
ncbi:unnamed protein product [Toxocara canis]|uniref:Uncharacterized protein n=1 Tax=Toxocara canis TaxID=6265 RepID=A0A183VDD3_TOXCA|nr:unnamed protein product [Toxocara canis]